jgi:hypothetical protein
MLDVAEDDDVIDEVPLELVVEEPVEELEVDAEGVDDHV